MPRLLPSTPGRSNAGFEGTTGRLAGAVMSRMNRDMERAAVQALDPSGDHSVLAVGFGPGIGLVALAERMPGGFVAGIDPSAAMVERARRRVHSSGRSPIVRIERAGAESIPYPDDAFDGVVAVNSVQLWEPLGDAVREVGRVLAPGGTLVVLTHTWAIEKQARVAEWTAAFSALLRMNGLSDITTRTETFRSGPGLLLEARMRRDRNPIAP
jgi:ubiquinone/menaquinone biosynthesis C-methylase UbiE